ncbi:MAG: Sca4 family protein, partial [Rickettsiaceae bacterium]|nr:Sca4 family protein [Rickettsiaceae bacterium]
PAIITAPSPQQLTKTTVAQPTQKIPTHPQVKVKAENVVSAKGTSEKSATVSAVGAKDKVIISLNPSEKVLPFPSSPRVFSGSGVDPITQAIRDKVLTKQQSYLQQEIAKIIPVEGRSSFLNQDLSSFRTFLQTETGKEKLSSVMQKPETENQLKNIESNGYKEVHSQFQGSFKNVGWVPLPNSKTRLSEIKDADGQRITYLKETTVQGATQVALEDGTMRSIKSYRQIEFPKEIETGKGPVHFSMAVKDENGRNIPEKGAVYFTAHYDDKGKLTEVSSPVPVKFMGKGDDAIGYIERGGKVYTLPVTQGKYKEMMLEVVANKGMGANISQSIETVAQDKVTAVKDSQKIIEEAKVIGKIYQEKKSEPKPNTPLTKTKNNNIIRSL